MENIFANALERVLADHCSHQTVRELEKEGSSGGSLWAMLEESGFPNAMLSEDSGGAGMSLVDAFPLLELCGAHALPLPLGETMVMRAILASAGQRIPEGPLAVGGKQILPPEALMLRACIYAAQLSGAMQTTLAMTLQYASERSQFGRPIGKFQAIQHQLSVMAEHVFAARMAAQMGCRGELRKLQLEGVAVAKARTSEAAHEVAAIAHAIHGAIGFTKEYALQLYTRRLHDWRRVAGSESYWHDVLGHALVSRSDRALDLVRQVGDLSEGEA